MPYIKTDRRIFLYILIITLLAVLLIIANPILHLNLPFSVNFLVGYVSSLLVYVVWHGIRTKGRKTTLLVLGVSFLIAFTAEALGVNFGLIFGKYHYTAALGPQLFGVPFLAALAWEPILYAAYCMTDVLAPSSPNASTMKKNFFTVCLWMALLGALATTAWDLMIDPIAVSQGWWVWEEGGAYMPYIHNGVPISNYIGWLAVSFTILLIERYWIVRISTPLLSNDVRIYAPITLYASLFLTSFGVTLTILNHPEIAFIGLMAMGAFLVTALTNLSLIRNGLSFHPETNESLDNHDLTK